MKRTLGWIVVVVVVVGGIAARVVTRGSKTPARSISEIHAAEGVPVDVATVRAGLVRTVVEMVGEVSGSRQSTLRSFGAQKIARVNVREGQRVRRGTTLLEFDVGVFPDRSARLEQTMEAYDNAKRQVERLTPLFADGAISESDLDNAQTQLAIAEANMRDSRLELEVVSPIDGVAILVAVRPGDAVDDGAVLVQVASLDSVRVIADIAGATAAALRTGQSVFLAGDDAVAESGPAARGAIAQVSLGADPDTRLFRAEAVLDNADRRLMPGHVVRLGVVVAVADGVPVVPIAAALGETVPERGGSTPVYVIREGVSRRVVVQTGLVGDDALEVVAGVEVGERVVVFGANQLPDGARVRLHRVDGVLVEDPAAEKEAGE